MQEVTGKKLAGIIRIVLESVKDRKGFTVFHYNIWSDFHI